MAPLACPACGKSEAEQTFPEIERHQDPVAGTPYRLLRCPGCGVGFSQPRIPPDSDWYAKAFAYGILERHPADEGDWRFQRFLRSRLPSPAALIDIGCGEGEFLRVAQGFGYRTTGFDFDPAAVAKARASGLDAHCVDFSSLLDGEKDREPADILTLFDVLEHVPEPAAFLGRLKRFVKPGGHLVVTLPDDRCPHPWGHVALNYPPCHFTRWTPRALTLLLEAKGFDVLRVESEPLVPRYLSGQFFFNFLMPRVLPLLKRLLFRSAASGKKTVSQWVAESEGSVSPDRGLRQKLVDAAAGVFCFATYPAARIAIAYFKWNHRRSGDGVALGQTLFVLARRDD